MAASPAAENQNQPDQLPGLEQCAWSSVGAHLEPTFIHRSAKIDRAHRGRVGYLAPDQPRSHSMDEVRCSSSLIGTLVPTTCAFMQVSRAIWSGAQR